MTHRTAGSETTAPDVVASYVRKAVRSGELLPGHRISERELSDACFVGRNAVREGLMRLVADGTLVREPGHSAVVRKFTLEEVWAHHQIRESLEGLAAGLAAGRPDQARYHEALRNIDRRLKECASIGDRDGFFEANSEFHSIVVEMGGNPFIQSHIDLTRASQLRMQSSRFMTIEGMQRSHAEHEAIIVAILSGDTLSAEASMRKHIRGTRRIFLEMGDTFLVDEVTPLVK